MKKLTRALMILLPLITFGQENADAAKPSPNASWRIDYHEPQVLETQCKFEGARFLTPKTSFTVRQDATASKGAVLLVEAKKSTGVLLAAPAPVNLEETPIMRWRWRILKPIVVPPGKEEPDDQAAVLYFGDGTLLSQKCVGYRWSVNTPINTSGVTKYAAGMMTVAHQTIRNKSTPIGEWVTEERDVLADYEKAYKKKPDSYFIVSVGANSQYSGSHSIAEIDFIEFIPKK